jgi:hypothetical protein
MLKKVEGTDDVEFGTWMEAKLQILESKMRVSPSSFHHYH